MEWLLLLRGTRAAKKDEPFPVGRSTPLRISQEVQGQQTAYTSRLPSLPMGYRGGLDHLWSDPRFQPSRQTHHQQPPRARLNEP